MSQPSFESFMQHLGMLLRDQPKGTTADLLDQVCAYWTGWAIQGIYLREDGSGRLDDDFELDEGAWREWQADLLAWQAHPRFTYREELCEWLKELPPRESGG
ncbi:hypothetical protein [Caballeronia sp. BCC1704]|uniref:hypothetical protein n=1 Tax=Caballeronia sp. BCC1704 TaxID=2676300 RepID=UPI00158EFBF8|nr:hypothetical protein [Caballeronia sp. BCC1704]